MAERLILDNILIANKMFHILRTNKFCQNKFIVVKIDMNKVYDRVEWAFVHALLTKIRFTHQYVYSLDDGMLPSFYIKMLSFEAYLHIQILFIRNDSFPFGNYYHMCYIILFSHLFEIIKYRIII